VRADVYKPPRSPNPRYAPAGCLVIDSVLKLQIFGQFHQTMSISISTAMQDIIMFQCI